MLGSRFASTVPIERHCILLQASNRREGEKGCAPPARRQEMESNTPMNNEEEPEAKDPLDDMAPSVRLCLEKGNAIRVAKAEMTSDIAQFVADLVELYPGHEDTIRKGLEGAAAQLLATRDKRKRDERRAQEEDARAAKAAAAAEKGDGDGPGKNSGANGVSGAVHSLHAGDTDGGAEDQGSKEEAG